jgi:hypothetical protein
MNQTPVILLLNIGLFYIQMAKMTRHIIIEIKAILITYSIYTQQKLISSLKMKSSIKKE